MNPVSATNPLASMLDNAFGKLDTDKDGTLNRQEFGSFYEILKPGIATGEDGRLQRSEQDEWERMDTNGDGAVSREEMQGTPVLMPAALSSTPSLDAMVQYLLARNTESATEAARLLDADAGGASAIIPA